MFAKGTVRGPRSSPAGRAAALVAAWVTLCPEPASATYSIVAADRATAQVGAAGTSCVGPFVTIISIYGSVPGRGAVVAQARLNSGARDEAVRLLEQEMSPSDIIAAITSAAFDPFGGAGQRQYAVVDVTGRSAGFTGEQTMAYADDQQGTFDPFVYSVQGNILTGQAVLEQASAGFEQPACDLADRLMSALERGAANAQGDSRCTPQGIPSDGAFIEVDRPDAARGDYLRLEVNDTAPDNPITLLRAQFDAWRTDHPCAEPADDAGARDDGGTDGAAPSSGGAGSGDASSGGVSSGGAGGAAPNAGGVDGSTGGAIPNSGGIQGTGAGGAALDSTAPSAAGDAGAGVAGSPGDSSQMTGPGNDSGCGCRAVRAAPNGASGSFALIAVLIRSCRRRRGSD